jgi:hypothetical protein
MESSNGGRPEFHWGDCKTDTRVTDVFSSLQEYSAATGCGYFEQSSVLMRNCHSSKTLGFICENPLGNAYFAETYTS